MQTETVITPARRSVLAGTTLRVLALLALLSAAPLYEAFRVTAFYNGDIWWHLRTGLWILQNHAIPRQGLFSQCSSNPWIASNWGFEVLTAGLYKLLGLRSIPALLMGFKLGLAAIAFLLAYMARRNFWAAVFISAAAQYAIVDLQPLPNLCSILLFGVELLILLYGRRTGDMRPLLFLPVLFCCWANFHLQFIYGLLLLILFVLSQAVEQLLQDSGFDSFPKPALPISKTLTIAGISCLATLLTPYSVRLYPEIIGTLYSKVQFSSMAEMTSMEFRRPQNFVLMLLVMAAFFALGRQRSRDLFKISTMGIFVMLAFRIQRDAWCVVLPAIAVLAGAVPGFNPDTSSTERKNGWGWGLPVLAVLTFAILLGAILSLPNDDGLVNKFGRVLPVKACNFIRANQLAGPMFNSYAWGGFLTWYLPEYPVAIDGRVNLYGDELNEKYFKVTGGSLRMEEDPSFVGAQIVLMERNSAMVKALTSLPALRQQFRVAYEDDLATVLVRNP